MEKVRPGARPKYTEKTAMVSFRCPVSKIEEFKKYGNDQLDKWKKIQKNIKVSPLDQPMFDRHNWTINKSGNKIHVCRVANGSRGKFNVLLAQDIIGILCEIKFIDGNTLNCERENIRAINREVEFIY